MKADCPDELIRLFSVADSARGTIVWFGSGIRLCWFLDYWGCVLDWLLLLWLDWLLMLDLLDLLWLDLLLLD